jgi:hypothetical protein
VQKYINNVTSSNGDAIAGALVTLQNPDTTPVQLYSDNGITPMAQPVVTDSLGGFSFYAADGRYNLFVHIDGVLVSTITDLLIEDPIEGNAALSVRSFVTNQVDGVTSNQDGIVAAVAAAFAAGADLEWPSGTYVSSATIPNFHSVKHIGPGVIKRGTDTFHIGQADSDTNRLYLATTGNSANDGLSSAEPLATFQQVFDITKNYGPVLPGVWDIISAAGTYTLSSGQHTFSTPSKNRVTIRGPVAGHPNVPTCVIDGGGNQAAYMHGLSASGLGVRVEFRDIKVQNFTEASGNTRIGCVGENECDFYTNNVHAAACSWTGLYAFNTVRTRIAGGIQDGAANAGAACIIVNSSQCTIGYGAASAASGPIVKNGGIGIYWSRGTQGHVDYTNIQDCGYGLQIGENSRVDTVANDFKRNTIGIRCFTGGVFGEGGAPNVWNNGTADANTTNVASSAYSGNSDELLTSQSWSRVAYDRVTRALAGTAPTTLSTPYTIPAYRLAGAGKSCRVHAVGVFTQATAGSVLTVNFGGMALALTVPGAATNVAFELDVTLHEVSGGYRAVGKLGQGLSAQRFGTTTAGFTNTSDQAISVAATLANAGDSLNIYRTDVYLIG